MAQAQDRATRERATAAVSSLVDDVLSNDAADDGAETLNGKKKSYPRAGTLIYGLC